MSLQVVPDTICLSICGGAFSYDSITGEDRHFNVRLMQQHQPRLFPGILIAEEYTVSIQNDAALSWRVASPTREPLSYCSHFF